MIIIPKNDIKLSQFKFNKDSYNKPVHFLSNMKCITHLNHVTNNVLFKKIILNSSIEKDYIICFSDDDYLNYIKTQNKHPYFMNSLSIDELSQYCNSNKCDLLLHDKTIWHKIDFANNDVSIYNIKFK
jgi:hypothetical protein